MQKWDELRDIIDNQEIDLNVGDRTILHWACWSGNLEFTKILLQNQRININLTDSKGETPFFIACQYGHLKIVEEFIKLGIVNFRAKNHLGLTAHDIAKENQEKEIVNIIKLHDTGFLSYFLFYFLFWIHFSFLF